MFILRESALIWNNILANNGPMEMEAFEKVEFQNVVLQHDLNWYGMANAGEFHKGAAYLDCSGASYRVQQIGDSS